MNLLLLVGYAGAGPYPQCFVFDTLDEKSPLQKRAQFLEQAIRVSSWCNRILRHFAGTYILGSRLSVIRNDIGMLILKKH